MSELDNTRGALLSQLDQRISRLAAESTSVRPVNGHANGRDPAPASTHKPKNPRVNAIDLAIANEARVSVGQVRAGRRLVRAGNENLTIMALFGLLPVTTALRGATPPRSNARYDRWRGLLALAEAVQ